MANIFKMKNAIIGLVVAMLTTGLIAQKPRDISGTIVGVNGDKVAKTIVVLLAGDGTEVKREETSRRGAFKFKKVSPGSYNLNIDAGESGSLTAPAEVTDSNLKLGDLQLKSGSGGSTNSGSAESEDTQYDPTLSDNVVQDGSTTMGNASSNQDSTSTNSPQEEFTPDPGKDYILNELSFEIKKMTAELKYLNEELENFKSAK